MRASTVEPIGIAATPLSGMKPLPDCARPRPGSLTKTSPEICRTIVVTPATGATLPAGSCSQALPMPSASTSAWSALAAAGQLSLESATPSRSVSAGGLGGGGGGGAAIVKVDVAGVESARP